jgi:hypothetical protein
LLTSWWLLVEVGVVSVAVEVAAVALEVIVN